jgi:hypothetical protein
VLPVFVEPIDFKEHIVESAACEPNVIGCFEAMQANACLEDSPTAFQDAKRALNIFAQTLGPPTPSLFLQYRRFFKGA